MSERRDQLLDQLVIARDAQEIELIHTKLMKLKQAEQGEQNEQDN